MITQEDVLERLKMLSSKHYHPDPPIGIDSLALQLGVPQLLLVELLQQLEAAGKVHLESQGKMYNGKGFRLTTFGKVRLRQDTT
jgi:DNA-binding GntR family transcriptional regulator